MNVPTSKTPMGLRLSALLGGSLVCAFIFAALFGSDGVTRHEQLKGELRDLDRMNRTLQADNRRLTAETKALRNDADYIEHVIRDELGWVAPDDMVLIFPKADPAD